MVKDTIINKTLLSHFRKSIKVKYDETIKKGKRTLTQKQFSELAEIPLDSLRNYESGRRKLTTEKFLEIKKNVRQNLGYRESDKARVRVMVDYLRITFKEVKDLKWFCQEYLYCDLKEFSSEATGLMRYTHLWRRGDVWIFDYADRTISGNYQITLQLSGAGCRQFELLLERAGKTWMEALQKMATERKDMSVTRIDIAMDEMWLGYGHEDEQLDLFTLVEKRRTNEMMFDRIEGFNHIGGGSYSTDKNGNVTYTDNGLSIYCGSRQSTMFFNFYEKRYELAKKERMTVDEALAVFEVWNRYELRFSDTKAQAVVSEFIAGVDIAEVARGILAKEIQVYHGTNAYGAYLHYDKWQRLFGGVEPLKLSTQPEEYNILRTVKWLIHQVSNSIALISEADKKMATSYLKMIIESGEIGDKEKKILEQLNYEDKQYLDEFFGLKVA